MDDDDLNLLSKEVFAAVGPARIASVSLLYAQSRLGQGARDGDEVSQDMLMMSANRLRMAHAMVTTDFPDRMTSARMEIGQSVQTKLAAVVQSLETFGPIVTQAKISAPQICAFLSSQPDLSAHCFETMEPAINGFLDATNKELADAQLQRSRAQFERATEAVSQVQRIGTSIRMVAINASVEAARAGDAGAGFGVIASETQALATQMAGLMVQIEQSLTAQG